MDALENQSRAYNAGNQIQNDISFDYSYDNSGNLTSKANRANPNERTDYTYDYESRLTGAVIKDATGAVVTTAQYKYDPFGRRIEKNVNGVVTKYLYDEEDIVAEYDGAGNVIARYVHGPGIDEPLAMTKNGQNYFYNADVLGSITSITDSAQAVVQAYKYDAYGSPSIQDPSFTQPYLFTSREWDGETGPYYYRARIYNPNTGTFIQKDPIGFAGKDVNLYRYAKNSPIKFIDPSGLDYIFIDMASGMAFYITGNGDVWAAEPFRSGINGVTDPSIVNRGPTPAGYYLIENPTSTISKTYMKGAFCDPSGNCWWAAYHPIFETPNNRCLPNPQGTGNCGMHPDGNTPGTSGCTGLSANWTNNMRILIDYYNPSPGNPLLIEIWNK